MQNVIAGENRSVSCLVVTWVLMIPLVYFASWGNLWFQNIRAGDALSEQYGALVSGAITARNAASAVPILALVLVIAFPKIPSITRAGRRDVVFALFVLLAMASCIWSQFPVRSLEYSLCLAVDTLFAFYVYQKFSPGDLLKVLYYLGWICLISSFVLSLFFPKWGVSQGPFGTTQWRGMYPHKNGCAMMTVFLLSVSFYLPARTFPAKFFRMAYVGLSIILVLMTRSITGVILLFCLLGYTAVVRLTKRFDARNKMAVLALISVMVMLAALVAIAHFSEISYLLGKDPTLTKRTEIWQAAMTSVLKHPVCGFGYMAFTRGLDGESANLALSTGAAGVGLQSGFLETWLGVGIFGLGLFLYSLLRALRNAKSAFYQSQNLSDAAWYLCIIFLLLVSSIGETGTIMSPNSLVWVMYMIACLGLSDSVGRTRLRSARA